MAKKSNKSFYTLAQKVLQENKKPMHYMDITKEILKIKETKGKTPERTVMAVILRDKHNVFKSVGEGVFTLTSIIH
ncbi:MAG: winged helix-turn-helix domain-containing protein [Nanoarchaeota archaeon]|nr:winged helix-turn-helix domain-containing protein [Nanoarchaeota archaeon]MBU1269306.1 winged helix-turn-helix domain-containing protein [Nanoarchaeota archaeon]MBU1603756.1 winged helix-turn-helix domain-containing protein [Nanoarchaeota archaeon]MBU2443882.1 winged helix-turn-helix domain-containing protein [Nanoarchaeota archaeon]